MDLLKRSLIPFYAVLLAVASVFASHDEKPAQNRNIRFGLPSPATKDIDNKEAYLIERPQFVLSYNGKKHNPNWVSWQLRKSDLGKADRGPFEPDPLLPKGFLKITTKVYANGGFDRGHMCPSADRADSEMNNDPTFYTTNIVPQAPDCNRKTWERLEAYSRGLVASGKTLHIVCGPHGTGGLGSDGKADAIGPGKLRVNVPAKVWKVILVLSSEDAEPAKDTRTIAVVVPNEQGIDTDWSKFRVSVAEVEKMTGFTFFPSIPAEIGTAIKADTDNVLIPPTKKKKGVN